MRHLHQDVRLGQDVVRRNRRRVFVDRRHLVRDVVRLHLEFYMVKKKMVLHQIFHQHLVVVVLHLVFVVDVLQNLDALNQVLVLTFPVFHHPVFRHPVFRRHLVVDVVRLQRFQMDYFQDVELAVEDVAFLHPEFQMDCYPLLELVLAFQELVSKLKLAKLLVLVDLMEKKLREQRLKLE
jgi:hypothetical protein